MIVVAVPEGNDSGSIGCGNDDDSIGSGIGGWSSGDETEYGSASTGKQGLRIWVL